MKKILIVIMIIVCGKCYAMSQTPSQIPTREESNNNRYRRYGRCVDCSKNDSYSMPLNTGYKNLSDRLNVCLKVMQDERSYLNLESMRKCCLKATQNYNDNRKKLIKRLELYLELTKKLPEFNAKEPTDE